MKPPSEQQAVKTPHILTARSCRFAAYLFNFGNILTVLVPPLGMLWIAVSMVIYALNRHHPNEKVGHYTQIAAYRLYGVTGAVVAAAIFIPRSGINYYLGLWALAALIILPLSLRDLYRINKDDWCDTEIDIEAQDYD